MGIMARRRKRQGISIHIDEWTNSIVEIKTGKVFETILIGLNPTDARQIVERDWTFSWRVEIIEAQYEFYKLTTFENKRQIQGLISLRNQEGFIEVVNVEVAKINRGNNRIYKGIGTNLFDFACKLSKERGLGGFVGFVSKSNLISHYIESLGAKVLAGQRMAIDDVAAEKLINFYFP